MADSGTEAQWAQLRGEGFQRQQEQKGQRKAARVEKTDAATRETTRRMQQGRGSAPAPSGRLLTPQELAEREQDERKRTYEWMGNRSSREADKAQRDYWETRAARPVLPNGGVTPGDPYVTPNGTGVGTRQNRDRASERLMAQYYGARVSSDWGDDDGIGAEV